MKYLFILFLLFCIHLSNAQLKDLRQQFDHTVCPSGSILPFELGSKPKAFFRNSLAESNSEVICGRFKMIFEDIILGTGYGFDDINYGQGRIMTLCNVLSYVQSVIEIPPGDSTYIELYILESNYIYTHNLDPAWLAFAGPFESADYNNGIDGFYSGLAQTHITSGADPDTNFYDGLMCYEFMHNSQSDDYNRPIYGNYCSYDLHAIALHEITHVLGFRSLVEEDTVTFIPRSLRHPLKQYSLMDKRSLFYGDVATGNFTQVVDSNTLNINTGAYSLRQGQLWLSGQKAPHNFGLFAGVDTAFINNWFYLPGHLFEWQHSFDWQGYIAPAYRLPSVVMGPYMYEGHYNYNYSWSKFELKFLQTLGYQFKQAFLADSSVSAFIDNSGILNNSYAYTSKKCIWSWRSNNLYATDSAVVDYVTDNCNPVLIDISMDTTLHDPDGDPISIFPGSLFNIRGCGIHGNNHDALVISPDGTKITFNPRADFMGRAQFGFDLFDGKERGQFIVYTIDVNRNDSCFNSNGNIVINGDFEEGSEVATYTNPEIENATFLRNENGKYSYGYYFIDGAHYPSGIDVIRSSMVYCWNADSTINGTTFGNYLGSFDYPFHPPHMNFVDNPLPVNNVGDRYCYVLASQAFNEPLSECNKYRISFDICFRNLGDWDLDTSGSSVVHVRLEANCTDPWWIVGNALVQQLDLPATFTVPSNWVHFDTTFMYCSPVSAKFISILTSTGGPVYLIDNLSLTKVPFTYEISPIPDQYFCEGDTMNLSAVLNDTSCGVTWQWQSTSNWLSCYTCSNTLAFPVIERSAIVQATVGNCIIEPDTFNFYFQSPPPLIDIGNNSTICDSASVILYNHTPVSPTTWYNGITSDSIAVNAGGLYYASTYDGCRHNYDTVLLSSPPQPAFDLGSDTSFCQGESITLFNHTPAFPTTWFNGTISDSINVSSAGIYTASTFDGCVYNSDTILITVRNLPIVELGNDTVMCNGGSFIISSPPADLYLWSTGETTSSIVINSSGLYGVTVTVNNCSSSDFIHFNPYNLHTDTLENGFLVCEQSPVVLHAPVYASNVTWNNGEQANSIQVNQPGTYMASFNDSVCPSSKSFIVSEYPFVSSNIYRDGDTLFASNGNMFIYQWFLNNELIQSSQLSYLYPIQQGNYHLQIIDSTGCVYVQGNHVVNNSGVFVYYHHEAEELIIHGSWHGKMKVTLSDMLGQILFSKELAESLNIVSLPLHSLNVASAYYFITLESDDVHETFKVGILPGY